MELALKEEVKDLQGGVFKNLKGVIKLIDDLRDCGIEEDVKLPKIVVVGTQSSGKSSLLEQIVGLDFLPRGTGVVTRTPLEIRLVHVAPKKGEEFKPYAYFGTEKDKIYFDFNTDVKKRIEEITDERAGKNKNIVDDLITLTIFSSTCPNLTLIDLPGITKVPLENSDQPENIEQITKDLTKKYIKDKMCIILCVIPINQDLSVSDALQLSREYDKEGHRTFGVLTKIDIMDQGTSCLNVLQNKIIRLKHGYVGVKCRSQKDIESNKTVEQALTSEEDYFRNHDVYSSLSGCTGTRVLSNKLSKLLDSHIREHMPQIQSEIIAKISEKERLLQILGDQIPEDESGKRQLLVKKTIEVAHVFNELMLNILDPSVRTSFDKLKKPFGNQFLLSKYSKFSQTSQPILDKILTSYKLKTVGIDLVRFSKPIQGFLPYEAFQSRIREIIPFFITPALQLLDETKSYIQSAVTLCVEEYTSGSQTLQQEMVSLVSEILDKFYLKTMQLIEDIYESEKTFTYSRNDTLFDLESKFKMTKIEDGISIFQYLVRLPDFMEQNVYSIIQLGEEIHKSLMLSKINQITYQHRQSPLFSNQQPIPNNSGLFIPSQSQSGQTKTVQQPSIKQYSTKELEETNEETTQLRIDIFTFSVKFYSYVTSVHLSLSEQIPKIIETFLVKKFSSNLQISIFNQLSEQKNISQLLTEDSDVQEQRKKTKLSLESLYKARSNISCLNAGSQDNSDLLQPKMKGVQIDLDLEDQKNEEEDYSFAKMFSTHKFKAGK